MLGKDKRIKRMEDEIISLHCLKHRGHYLVLVTIPFTIWVLWKCLLSWQHNMCCIQDRMKHNWPENTFPVPEAEHCTLLGKFWITCKSINKMETLYNIFIQHVLHDTTTMWVGIVKATKSNSQYHVHKI